MDNITMKTGYIVKVSGAYSKAQNGLYVVITSPGDPTTSGRDYRLLRVTQAGKVSQSDRSTIDWPLRTWSNNRDYCTKANAWNKAHAEITHASVKDMSEIVAYFRVKSDDANKRAEHYAIQWGEDNRDAKLSREISAFYASVVSRIQPAETAGDEPEKPKAASPIKFYWNGLKINDGKLIRCSYSLDNRHDGLECVTIYAKDYSDHLPGDLFQVENDTDFYTDYHDNDRAEVFPDHPLYSYARVAAIKAELRNEKYYRAETCDIIRQKQLKRLWKYKQELETLPTGQPTISDVESVHTLNLAAETARLAVEKEQEQKDREAVLAMRNAGRVYIEEVAAAHPIQAGAPVVTIECSEHPAFYSWEDGELKLSVAAAEIVLRHYDEQRAEHNAKEGRGGYDKTSFSIEYTDENGEQSTYTGRYDLGDNDGGLIAHIRAFAQSYQDERLPYHSEADAAKISAIADLLEAHTAAGRVVSVSVAPWLEDAVKTRHKAAAELARNTLDMVEMLTDEQLAAAVLSSPKDTPDVARFFLQALARRDQKKALSVFRAWRSGAGLETLDEI